MHVSLIIPVYNRPQEVAELLESLSLQTDRDFQTVIVEDGSVLDSRKVVEAYADRLDIVYCVQPNGGPSAARNRGAREARGDFFIFMDSDCIVPEGYVAAVRHHLEHGEIEFFGGPDSAAADFSPLQKAVSYSMTSFFTTGGIRGGHRRASKFFPRSFNLGISRELFAQVGGFPDMRIGEDIEFSMRVMETGVRAELLSDAVVCHKRRTSMRLFFKQVFVFGTARVNLMLRRPQARKFVYLLPVFFTLGSILLVILSVILSLWWLSPLGGLALLWFVDASLRNRNLYVGWLSIWTSFIQLYGYGCGFLYGWWCRRILHRSECDTYVVTTFFRGRDKTRNR